MAISCNFELPVGSTAALTAKEVTPLTTPEGVVIATVGPASAKARTGFNDRAAIVMIAKNLITFLIPYPCPVKGQSANITTVLPAYTSVPAAGL